MYLFTLLKKTDYNNLLLGVFKCDLSAKEHVHSDDCKIVVIESKSLKLVDENCSIPELSEDIIKAVKVFIKYATYIPNSKLNFIQTQITVSKAIFLFFGF